MRIPSKTAATPRITLCSGQSYDEVTARAAAALEQAVRDDPAIRLGLATGSTPIGIYNRLTDACCRGHISFKQVTTVNLDEYVGLDSGDPQSYAFYMRQYLFGKVDIPTASTHIPSGVAADLDAECAAYDALLDAHPAAIQLLGIGRNGHVGFNEPSDAFTADTHIVQLTESTIEANSRFFSSGEVQPTRAITMGIRGILSAGELMLVACGEDKAEALHEAIFGEVTPACPASVIQLHPRVRIYADTPALKCFTPDQLSALRAD